MSYKEDVENTRKWFDNNETIYLDYHATTPCDPRVVEELGACYRYIFGNPSSPHSVGKKAKDAVEEARTKVASAAGCRPGEIYFTRGATEANNIAIRGIAKGSRDQNRKSVVVSAIEHKSVLKAAKSTEEWGYEVKVAPVTENGRVDLKALEEIVGADTLLVSIQGANNEVGTVQPLSQIGAIAKEEEAYFHCDATQLLGRYGITPEKWGVDLLSLSAHKAYGPKGAGALYVSGGYTSMPVVPLFYGGGQEEGLVPGTESTPEIVGFGKACTIIDNCLSEEAKVLQSLRDRFEDLIKGYLDKIEILGESEERLPSTSNIWLHDTEAEAVVARLSDVAISTGSACESGAPEPSHVLQAMGLTREEAYGCIRLCVGRFTEREDVEIAAQRIAQEIKRVRSLRRE